MVVVVNSNDSSTQEEGEDLQKKPPLTLPKSIPPSDRSTLTSASESRGSDYGSCTSSPPPQPPSSRCSGQNPRTRSSVGFCSFPHAAASSSRCRSQPDPSRRHSRVTFQDECRDYARRTVTSQSSQRNSSNERRNFSSERRDSSSERRNSSSERRDSSSERRNSFCDGMDLYGDSGERRITDASGEHSTVFSEEPRDVFDFEQSSNHEKANARVSSIAVPRGLSTELGDHHQHPTTTTSGFHAGSSAPSNNGALQQRGGVSYSTSPSPLQPRQSDVGYLLTSGRHSVDLFFLRLNQNGL
ncbi:hypothetical protein ACOMHN_041091 [Nucella lapillus]